MDTGNDPPDDAPLLEFSDEKQKLFMFEVYTLIEHTVFFITSNLT